MLQLSSYMKPEDEVKYITNLEEDLVNIDDLKYDEKNPRLAHLDDPTKFEHHLIKVGNVSELVQELILDKVMLESLVIDKNNVVIEGNRRLAACKQLIKKIDQGLYKELDRKNFSYLRCKKIPSKISNEGTVMYLITVHMRSKKPWKLFNRANYIYKLHSKHGWSKNKISMKLNITRPTLDKTLKSHSLTIKYKIRYGSSDNNWSKKYSYFWQLLTTKGLKEIASDEDKIVKYMEWVYMDKFKIYQEVRKLPDIIKHRAAFKEFKNIDSSNDRGKSFRFALQVLDQENPALTNPKFKKIDTMSNMFRNMSHTDIKKIKSDTRKMRIVERLSESIKMAFGK